MDAFLNDPSMLLMVAGAAFLLVIAMVKDGGLDDN